MKNPLRNSRIVIIGFEKMKFYKLMTLFNKAIHNKTLVNGSLFSLFSFWGQGMNFLLLILLANYIQPQEYGHLSLFTTIVTFVGFIMAFSTRGYSSVTYFKKQVEDFKKDFTATIVLGGGSFAMLAIPLLFCGDWLGDKLELSKQLLWYVLVISFMNMLFLLQQDYLRIKEKVVSYGIYSCCNALLNFGLTLFFVIAFHQSWLGRVNALLICTVLFGVISCVFFYRNDLIRITGLQKVYYDALAWGMPMIPHVASGWIRQGLDRYIINFYHTTYEVGVFSFALNICNVIDMIGMAFNSTNSVTLFKTLSNDSISNIEKRRILFRQTRNIAIIYLVVSLVVVMCSVPLVYWGLPKYMKAIPYIVILSICGILKCMYYLYCNYMFYYNQTKQLMYITFLTSVMHLFLSLYFTRYSLYYTAIIYIVIQALVLFLVVRKSKVLINQNLVS